jgi:hypothetical protein
VPLSTPPPPPGLARPQKLPQVCVFVTTKRPNRVGERAGNAQEAELRLPLKRGASGTRRRPTTEQRSCSCVPLSCGVHTHQAALNKSKIKKERRRTCENGLLWHAGRRYGRCCMYGPNYNYVKLNRVSGLCRATPGPIRPLLVGPTAMPSPPPFKGIVRRKNTAKRQKKTAATEKHGQRQKPEGD